jgi:hypothetical protein
VNREEAARLARFLGIPAAEFRRRYLRRAGRRYSLTERSNGDCVLYNRGCAVYPARPIQCRSFPFWPENLRSLADWERAGRECPGVERGRLYSADEIQLIRRGEGDAAVP